MFGIDGIQGQCDADDRAKKAKDRNSPNDDAKQGILIMRARSIGFGQIFEFVAKSFGRAQPGDVLHCSAQRFT